MDKLWAPWRLKYITKVIDKAKGDLFSKLVAENKDKKNYIFVRTKYCFAILNLYPYNNGHTLILPYRCVADLNQLTKAESADLFELLQYAKELLDEVLHPAGYNMGINLGRVAGAGFPQHLHFHIVPRWKGDVNFMPVIGGTKVISQSMDALYDLLVKAHRRREAKKNGGVSKSLTPRSVPKKKTARKK